MRRSWYGRVAQFVATDRSPTTEGRARAALNDTFTRIGLAEALAYTTPDNLRPQAAMTQLQLQRDPSRDFGRLRQYHCLAGTVLCSAPAPKLVPNRHALILEEMTLHSRIWRSTRLMAPCNLRPFLGGLAKVGLVRSCC
jgi:hypothetical protein